MFKNAFWILLFCLLSLESVSQRKITISGRITDSDNSESLIGVTVFDSLQRSGVVSNQYGYYSLSTIAQNKYLKISYVGYNSVILKINPQQDTIINVQLHPITLQEVTIKNIPTIQPGVGYLTIPIPQLKRIPMLMGEADLMKALALTPGIMVGQEGSSGLYVRGSSPEQNLILIDEAPVYNTSHAFGFLSVFNPDAIKNIDVYKGGFPARYGGRAASVIDLTTKDGNSQKHNQEVTVGLINARILLEGPLAKNKSSYMLTARQMNTFLLLLPQSLRWRGGGRVNQTNLWLYDINGKLNHRFKDNSQLFLSLYSNYDHWRNAERFSGRTSTYGLNWGNTTATLRYNKMITPQLFGRVTALYSRFNHQLANQTRDVGGGDETFENGFNVSNLIRDWGGKASLDYTPTNRYTIRTGIEQYWHLFHPGRVSITNNNTPIETNQSPVLNTQERALFLDNDIKVAKFLQFNLGARYVKYYTNDSTTYWSVEPRIGSVVTFTPSFNLKVGATQMRQFVHQLSSNGIGIPNDIWVPVTQKVSPILANQVDAGLYWTINKGYSVSLEAYQKQLVGLIDYPQGVDIVSDLKKNWQDLIVTNVEGRVKGVELMLRKDTGRMTGWVSYTRSNSWRRSPAINEGDWFAARYDRPHSITTVLSYHLTTKWHVNANWIYQSGFPVTLPTGAMLGLNSRPTLIYQNRNNERMPTYHRLDIGANYTFKTQRGREAVWNFGVYNLYNRQNPYYLEAIISTKQVGNNQRQFDGISIEKRAILPILPYFSYQLKLNKP